MPELLRAGVQIRFEGKSLHQELRCCNGLGRRVGRSVVPRLRFGDFSRASRSHTLAEATAQTHAILLFGPVAVARAVLLGRDPVLSVPPLPD